jgi:hypothetical protein
MENALGLCIVRLLLQIYEETLIEEEPVPLVLSFTGDVSLLYGAQAALAVAAAKVLAVPPRSVSATVDADARTVSLMLSPKASALLASPCCGKLDIERCVLRASEGERVRTAAATALGVEASELSLKVGARRLALSEDVLIEELPPYGSPGYYPSALPRPEPLANHSCRRSLDRTLTSPTAQCSTWPP